uniref:Uncharacterized protein n=1 Tax=Lepeophtheirus salmonis TaxID=72036 RepID=A0A0K2VGL5_LEPSM
MTYHPISMDDLVYYVKIYN